MVMLAIKLIIVWDLGLVIHDGRTHKVDSNGSYVATFTSRSSLVSTILPAYALKPFCED